MSSESNAPNASSVEDATAAFRELREYARGELDVEHNDIHPTAGVVQDARKRHVLEFFASAYDPPQEWIDAGMPRDFWQTEFAQRAKSKYGTDAATEAVREGNLTQTAFMSGLPSYKSDVSGLHAIQQLADWLVHSEQCKLIYLAALMGRGKTDFSMTMFEVIHDHYSRVRRSLRERGNDDLLEEVPEPEFAANFHCEAAPDDVEIAELHGEQELLDWAEGGSSEDERWFIFDEASTELTAQSGANAQKVAEKMAPFVKKMRKLGINMIVIGHDKGDVHVAIRSLADFVDKQGLKTASFYAGIQRREPVGHLFDLEGIPPTSWSFDTDDTADWEWIDEDEEDEEQPGLSERELKQEIARRGARLWKSTDITQQKVADALSTDEISVSRTMISRAADDIEQDAQIPNAKASL